MDWNRRSRRPSPGDCEVAVERAFREDRKAELDTEMAAPSLQQRTPTGTRPGNRPARVRMEAGSKEGSGYEGGRACASRGSAKQNGRKRTGFWLPRQQRAVRCTGRCPGTPPGGNPLRPPPPFPPGPRFRNGPRRQGFAAPRTNRAPLTAPGRSENLSWEEGKGACGKDKTPDPPPVGRPPNVHQQ
jgi:hypothetical protein